METRREFFKVSTIGENPELIKNLVVRSYIQVMYVIFSSSILFLNKYLICKQKIT